MMHIHCSIIPGVLQDHHSSVYGNNNSNIQNGIQFLKFLSFTQEKNLRLSMSTHLCLSSSEIKSIIPKDWPLCYLITTSKQTIIIIGFHIIDIANSLFQLHRNQAFWNHQVTTVVSLKQNISCSKAQERINLLIEQLFVRT